MTTIPRPINTIFERNPKITIFLVITISTLILDVVLTNIFALYTEIKNNNHVKPPILGVKNEVYHHDLIKNGMIEAKYTYHDIEKIKLHTNSLGFKDKSSRTIPLLPSKNFTKRIVFIGDSFTEGIMLEYEDTFVGMIDKELNNKSIEVLNAGVRSYSPIIYWRKVKYLIEEVGLKFNELVVFIDLSDIEDEQYLYRLSKRGNVIAQENAEPKRYDIYGHGRGFTSRIKTIIRSHTTLLYHTVNTLHDLINRDNCQRPLCLWLFERGDPDKEYAIQKMKKYMDRLHQLTRGNNIKLSIAVYPWPFQVWYEDLNSVYVKIWEEWSRRNNVNFINYFPDFISEGLTNKERLKIIKKYYIPFDVHFNKQGNKLLAKKFLGKYFPDRHF